MKLKFVFYFILIALLNQITLAQKSNDIITLDKFIIQEELKIKTLFNSLNLDLEELKSVKKAYTDGDIKNACLNLVEYYNTRSIPNSINTDFDPLTTDNADSLEIISIADEVLNDIYTFQWVSGKAEKRTDDKMDCSWKEPNKEGE